MTKERGCHQSKMPSDDILTIIKAYTVSPYRNLPEIQYRLQRRSCLSIVANHVQNVRSSPGFGGIGGSYAESVTVVWSDVVSLSQPDLSVSPNSILVTKRFFYMCSITTWCNPMRCRTSVFRSSNNFILFFQNSLDQLVFPFILHLIILWHWWRPLVTVFPFL